MYHLDDRVTAVKGIGRKTDQIMAEKGIRTIADLLLYLPLRYDDRSQIVKINQLQIDQTQTVKAVVVSTNEYFKNRRRITSTVIKDETGRTKCIWFNNRYIKRQLKPDQEYFFSGEYSRYRTLTQPAVEPIREETIHTGRLVPLYSVSLNIAQGTLRRILKEVVNNLDQTQDQLANQFDLMPLSQALCQLHFPEEAEKVIAARKRLALEELLALMKRSAQIKRSWQQQHNAAALNLDLPSKTSQQKLLAEDEIIPESIPFKLTSDQLQAVHDLLSDINQDTPMNRLLIGDVGTGKTVVAGIACHHMIKHGHNACLVAPTQILAKQHLETFANIFPDLPVQLLTAETKPESNIDFTKQQLFIGTHAVINRFDRINPALIIYDEQHRFGVAQRTEGLTTDLTASAQTNTDDTQQDQQLQPHLLTMTATPIPRSYMLTIFSHLDASIIEQSPFGPKPIKTWLVPTGKKPDAYQWLVDQLQQDRSASGQSDQPQQSLALVVCPFINPSDHEAFTDVASASEVYQQLKQQFDSSGLTIALLHGQQNSDQKQRIIDQLFNQEINLLVTTSIVEVGVDLPQANYIVIEDADRFGLASLHQLRGRVGRQGQKSYCLLFSQASTKHTKKRLQQFAQINNGRKLAELDLKNRGGGDLFGLEQHGFSQLRFASWSNSDLIAQARQIFDQLDSNEPSINLVLDRFQPADSVPAAN